MGTISESSKSKLPLKCSASQKDGVFQMKKWLQYNGIMLWDCKIMPVCTRNIKRIYLFHPLLINSNLSIYILPEIKLQTYPCYRVNYLGSGYFTFCTICSRLKNQTNKQQKPSQSQKINSQPIKPRKGLIFCFLTPVLEYGKQNAEKKSEKELIRALTVKRIVSVALNIGCHQLCSFLLGGSEPLFSKNRLLELEAVKKTVKII